MQKDKRREMSMAEYYSSVAIGASSGRLMLVHVEAGKMQLEV